MLKLFKFIALLASTSSMAGASLNVINYRYIDGSYSIAGDKYIYELTDYIKETSNTFYASIKLPANLSDDVVGGIIMGNYYNTPSGYPGCVDFAVTKGGYFDLYWNNGAYQHTFETADLRTGNWVDIALVREPDKLNFYVDGTLKETVNAETSEAICDTKYRIGMNWNNWYIDRWDNMESPFMGEIKQVALFSNALTKANIVNLHNHATPINSSVYPGLQTNLEFGENNWGKQELIEDTSSLHNNAKLVTFNRYVDVKEVEDYDYSFVVVPDMQAMTYWRPDLFTAQSDWLVKNAAKHKIQFAMYLGDMVESKFTTDPEDNDFEWYHVVDAMTRLDGKLPYSFVLGNHDYDSWATLNRNTTQFNKYMPYSKYSKFSYFGGAYEEGSMDNVYYNFLVGNVNYLVFALEEAPESRVLNWVDTIIDANPRSRVFITTHSFITPQGKIVSQETSKSAPSRTISYGEANDADKMWENHFNKHSNVVAIFSGHECADDIVYHEEKGIYGNHVYQFLTDVQGSIGTCAMNTFMLVKVNEKNKTWDLCYYSPEMDACFGLQNQFQLSFADKFNPAVGA